MSDYSQVADLYSFDRPRLAQAPTVANANAINNYNTALSPDREQAFQAWASKKWAGGGMTLPDVLKNYDMRGFFASGGAQADNGHFPDAFKKPNHPTFSDESIYNGVDGNQGGRWVQDAAGNWVAFEATPTNAKYHNPKELADYFRRVEPETKLEMLGGADRSPFVLAPTLGDLFR